MSQDNSQIGTQSTEIKTDAHIEGFDDTSSNDVFAVPSLTPKFASSKIDSSAEVSTEKKITISPAVVNPFLRDGPKSNKHKRPTTIWIQPYKERSRYLTDFEDEGVLGEGTFSVVYRARKRTDGVEYAVKRLTTRIHHDSEGAHMLREVCALAALDGCPNLVQYYNSWVEDGYVWLQMELCLKTNLDVFVLGAQSQHSIESSTPRSAIFSLDDDNCSGSVDENKDDIATQVDEPGPLVPQSELFTERVFWRVLHGVCSALSFMHSKGMAHLDIRPANILLSLKKSPSSGLPATAYESCDSVEPSVSLYSQLKCGDVSRSLTMTPSSSISGGDSQDSIRPPPITIPLIRYRTADNVPPPSPSITPESVRDNLTTGQWEIKLGDLGLCCNFGDYSMFSEGESRYCAGELISGSSKSIDFAKADVFSVGASLLELCTGKPLSTGGDANGEWHSLRDGTFFKDNQLPGYNGDRDITMYSEGVQSAIKQMLHHEAKQRPDATTLRDWASQEIRKHPVTPKSSLRVQENASPDASIIERLQTEIQRLEAENYKLRNLSKSRSE
eukprot:CAMPEP_0185038942 /NCGR_PEP_ID=MMETSP1103-20130426/35221_1 /TAXON_ID=36769 /ORGANISM="Paraphysomonas bandaiensis, Strain Caron Lab Isolate" /LENGTH=556 /DNA_ID=CAMNT_0027577619 /DNA_START=26 /DNA_END=1696 /DNA_ORIENTATION=+